VNDLVLKLLSELQERKKYLEKLIVRDGGRVFFLHADEIDWIEAAGNYVRLHAGKEAYLYRETMLNLEAQLNSERFVRIHRSAIVNLERIKELQPWFRGDSWPAEALKKPSRAVPIPHARGTSNRLTYGRLLTRAVQKDASVFAMCYRTATVRKRNANRLLAFAGCRGLRGRRGRLSSRLHRLGA
jgi:hypothetical protein